MSLYDRTSPSYQSLDQQHSLDYFMQIFSYYLKTQGSNDAKTVSATKSRSGPKLSQSIDSYLNYRKNIHNKLAEINANVSSMIIDSFKGIDSICFKVRQCMSENEDITRPKPVLIESFCEYETEEKPQIIEYIENMTNEKTETSSTNNINKNDLLDQKKLEDKLTAAKLSRNIKKRSLLLEEFRETIIENINNGDYEMMEKIVENIKEEIDSFTTDAELECKIVIDEQADEETFKDLKQKDIHSEIEIMNTKQSNNPLIKPNSTENLTKTSSIQIENFSEEKFDILMFEKLPLSENSVIAEVYSRPGILDINKKLVTQLVETDSFICFQRLMRKNKKRMKQFPKGYPKSEIFNDTFSVFSKYSHETMLRRCSTESLTSQRKDRKLTKKSESKVNDLVLSSSRKSVSRTLTSKNSISKSQSLVRSDERGNIWKKMYMKPDLRTKYSNSLWFSERYMLKTKKDAKNMNGNHGNVKRLKITNQSIKRQVTKRRPTTFHAPTPKSSLVTFQSDTDTNNLQKCPTGCSCNVSIKNDLPSPSNTTCRLRWMRAKCEQTHSRTIQFLDILDDLTPKDLLPLHSEYPRKDIGPTNKNVEDTYLYKLLYGGQDKQVWSHLLQPSIECTSTHCTKCRIPKYKKSENKKSENRKDDSFSSNSKIFSRETVLEKLGPHVHKQPYDKQYFQYVTILPVKVFYDRFKTNGTSPNKHSVKSNAAHIQKLPLLPMKETKGVDRASWSSPGSSKPMKVVYDGTVKKPEITPNITPAHKLIVNSARHKEEKLVFNKKISRSFSPKGFSPYCSTANYKNVPKQQTYISTNKTLDKYIKIQSDIEKKAKDFQEKYPSGADKKLWGHKYGKGVGQQLVTFIKNQPPHPTLPLPKYAVPPRKTKEISKEIATIPRASLRNTERHKQVLAHLHGLKEKNDEIQNNLQKAINVIEAKMIDILSTPGDSSSVEAFDVMEKEITNVLSMMKFSSKGSSRKSTPKNGESAKKTDKLESDFNLISDQLFKKLESILESEKSKGATSTSESDKRVRNTNKQDNKYTGQKPHSSNRNSTVNKFRSLSATSTSLDENEQKNTDISKKPNQYRDRIGKKSKMSKGPPPIISKRGIIDKNKEFLVQKLSVEEYTIEKIEREYATGESFGIECTIKTEQKLKPVTQDYDETDNSRGDCIKQDISKSTENVSSNVYNNDFNALLNDIDNKLDLKETTFKTASKEHIEEESHDNDDTKTVSQDVKCLNTIKEAEVLIKDVEKAEDRITIKDDEQAEDRITIKDDEQAEDRITIKDDENAEDRITIKDDEKAEDRITIEDDEKAEERIAMKENTATEADISPDQDQNYESLILLPDVETETESEPGLSGEVNKIIKRVEDIYSHLDDIQFSNDDHIPVFRDTHQVPNVHSQEFLTPFMQAVKDKRNSPDSPTKEALQRSPSYYNVLSFLDTLSDIQQETPIEVHTARLCYYCQLYHLPEIFYQAKLEFKINSKDVEKPSCLKKNSEEGKSKHKKVSFLVMKENKSCQVEICPFHNTKTLKVSSQQFPPIQNHTLPEEALSAEALPGEAGDYIGPTTEIFSDQEHLEIDNQLEFVEKNIIVLCDRRNQSDHSSEINHHSSEINHLSSEINQVSETTNSIKDICEETKPTDNFEIDKSTQVYCQMQTEHTDKHDTEKVKESNQPEEKYCEKSQQVSQVSEVSDESKSSASSLTDITPQIQVFYNQSNADIPKLILQNQPVEGKYCHQTILQVKNSTLSETKPHPKIVVFREVLDTTGLLKPLKNLDISIIKEDLGIHQDHRLPTRKSGKELVKIHQKNNDDREMLLRSFYAIVYILIFTALNLEYRCP